MKRFLILLFLVPFALLGQNLKDKINTDIRGKIYDPAKAANMHQAIVDGMIAVTASGTNAYTATVNAAITSYQTGYQQLVKFTNANTTASTINFNALGVKSLVKDGAGTALASGDLKANTTYLLSYDGTNFQVLNIPGSGGGGGISGLTSGRVTFATSGTTIGDSPDLTWDNTNKVLDIRTGGTARFQRSDNLLYWELGIPSGTSDITFSNSINVGFQFNTAGTTRWGYTNTQQFFIGTHLNFAANSYVFGGTTITAGSVLADFQSSTKGIVLPTATRASITTPVNGMLTVDTNVPYFHNATNWGKVIVADASNNIVLGGGATASQLRFLEPSGSGSNYASIEAPTLAANNNYILPNAYPTVSGQVLSSNTTGTMSWTPFALSGTASTTMTFPTTSATIARTDAAQTFTGVQSMTSPDITTRITTPSTSFDAFNTTATTGNLFGAATTLTIGATTGTLNLRNVTLTAANATSFAMNGASPSITTTSTGTASVFNTAALTGNLFGAATTLSVGGTPTGAVTHNYSANATATATTKTVNLGTAGAAGSTTNVNIGSATASAVLGTLTLGFPTIVQPSNYTSLALFNTQSTTVNFAGAATTFNLGGTPTTALTANIFTNATATATIKTINIGTGGASGSSTNVNIGSAVTGASSGTLTLGMTTIAQSANFTSINLLTTQTTTIDAFGVATNLSIGNTATAAQTVNMFTASTGASTYNIATGATLTATTKTINIGTAGVSGSTTNVSIGSATGGGQINLNERVIFQSTETAGGTTGNQTINLPSGSVNFAAAATSITVTNSLATTTSHIFCTIETNDATATIKNVVRASGSFTINLNAAATAETRVGFLVIN